MKLADIIIRGTDEVPPKVTIHLPPTPVVEVAPPLPTVKLPSKPIRPIKSGGTAARSPHPTFTLPPKLKLVQSGSRVDAFPGPTPAPVKPYPKVSAPKEKKPSKAGPKAQASGMSVNDLRACRNALKKVQEHKKAPLFLQPVDPVRDRAPKYVLLHGLAL